MDDNETVSTKRKKPRYSKKVDYQLPEIILNPNAKDNHGEALLENDLQIDETKATILEDETPRAAGHQGKDPVHHKLYVYVKTNEGMIVKSALDRHFSLITKCIYACGSEIGYSGDKERESCHYEVVMKRLLDTNAENGYRLSGIITPQLVRLIINSEYEEIERWRNKWKTQIESITHSLKQKCNSKDGGKR